MKPHRSSQLKYYKNLSNALKEKQKNAIINAFNIDYDFVKTTIRIVSELEVCISALENIIADEVGTG
ncbi:hypothetical protein [Brucella pituitosa]|uniref:hypothetical protein n=1 Tax=Brucella pituitosa TaxID=571256 RepID=UPI0009A20EBD|nr:hypothetical protein [Brucella pituitosa]